MAKSRKRKHPAISVHSTLNGELKVDWEKEYNVEFRCPYCQVGELTGFRRRENAVCKFGLECKSCHKLTHLTCNIPGMGLKYAPISTHQTLNGTLQVNWKLDYQQEYNCPRCNQGKITNYHYHRNSICKLALTCKYCKKQTSLTCQVPVHISRYCSNIECPNPLCNKIGHNGQKGWIYKRNLNNSDSTHQCYFCSINFKPDSTLASSWIGSLINEELLPLNFDEDIWDLKNFYDKPCQKALYLEDLHPKWYKIEVKKYLYYLLHLRTYSDGTIRQKFIILRQFGKVLSDHKIKSFTHLSRRQILNFVDIHKSNTNRRINNKLHTLKDFFEWSGLEFANLIYHRDFLKTHKNDPDWLDEITRTAIKQHLSKIPAPIARHYLIQEYTAARPIDIYEMAFDCLVEEQGKWYIKFYQHKTKKWHQIPVDRHVRRIIEEQQQWIRETLGLNYPYLFCHFRSFNENSYPHFKSIKPMPIPPTNRTENNAMIRIIRTLIEKENIRDANGQKPHFTGRITRSTRLQEVRVKHGMEAAQLYADHKSSNTTFQYYAPPTREQIAEVDLPFQELLMNLDNKFLPWQSLPESLLKNPIAHELDLDIPPRLVVYGHCALAPYTPCPFNLYPKCYGCSSFRPSTGKLPLYERQYQGEKQRLASAEQAGAELASEEAKATIEEMDKWLPELRRLADGEEKA